MNPKVREALTSSFARKGHPLSDPQVSDLLLYVSLLVKWNRRVRLTGLRDPAGIAGHLLSESLDFLRLWTPPIETVGGRRAMDVGAGAGIVGIPLGLLFPKTEMVLVESLSRKAAFLAEAIRALGAGNLRVVRGRAESLAGGGDVREKGGGHLGAYDAILCRAVAPVSEVLSWVWPLLAADGRLLIRQGRRGAEELSAAGPAMAALGALLVGETHVEGGRIIALGRGGPRFT